MSAPGASWDGLYEAHGRQEARYLLRAYTRRKCARCGFLFTHLILTDQVEFARRFYCAGGVEYDQRGERWVVRVCYLCWLRFIAARLTYYATPQPPPKPTAAQSRSPGGAGARGGTAPTPDPPAAADSDRLPGC